jgi:uncharacterized SAM-binding protein YcdF (DUF218 family)
MRADAREADCVDNSGRTDLINDNQEHFTPMFLLKKILAALILPPLGPLLVCLYGLWLARRRPRTGHALVALGLMSLLLASTPWVAKNLLQSLEDFPPIATEELATADAIVILGADTYFRAPEYGGDTVGDQALERVRYGARLARSSGLPVAIAGGRIGNVAPESELMRDVLTNDFGVETRWLETQSVDTEENARFLAPVLEQAGVHRVALVTHAWHMRRSRAAFERQGLVVLPAPTRLATQGGDTIFQWLPGATALRNSTLALHEWLGILAGRVAEELDAQ